MVTKPSSMEHPVSAVAQRVVRTGVEAPAAVPAVGEAQEYDVRDDEHTWDGDRGSSAETVTTGTTPGDPAGGADRRQRLRTTLELIRSNPTGRITLQVFVAVSGALVVALGIVLIPLPGPGWLLVIGGLGIWAIEFHWARRLLAFTKRKVQSWTRWIGGQSWPVRIVVGTLGMVFVGGVALLSLKYSLGIDLVADLLRYLATH